MKAKAKLAILLADRASGKKVWDMEIAAVMRDVEREEAVAEANAERRKNRSRQRELEYAADRDSLSEASNQFHEKQLEDSKSLTFKSISSIIDIYSGSNESIARETVAYLTSLCASSGKGWILDSDYYLNSFANLIKDKPESRSDIIAAIDAIKDFQKNRAIEVQNQLNRKAIENQQKIEAAKEAQLSIERELEKFRVRSDEDIRCERCQYQGIMGEVSVKIDLNRLPLLVAVGLFGLVGAVCTMVLAPPKSGWSYLFWVFASLTIFGFAEIMNGRIRSYSCPSCSKLNEIKGNEHSFNRWFE